MLVVDASVTVQACLVRHGFGRVEAHGLVAPPLLWSEVTSVLHEMGWRGEISADLAQAALARLSSAPIGSRRPSRLLDEAWSVSDELGWAKTYDAEYVALARLLGCKLLTIDARLFRGASRVVEIVGPADL